MAGVRMVDVPVSPVAAEASLNVAVVGESVVPMMVTSFWAETNARRYAGTKITAARSSEIMTKAIDDRILGVWGENEF